MVFRWEYQVDHLIKPVQFHHEINLDEDASIVIDRICLPTVKARLQRPRPITRPVRNAQWWNMDSAAPFVLIDAEHKSIRSLWLKPYGSRWTPSGASCTRRANRPQTPFRGTVVQSRSVSSTPLVPAIVVATLHGTTVDTALVHHHSFHWIANDRGGIA